MDSHTLEILEFDSVLDELEEYCFSVHGAETLRSQEFQCTPEQVNSWLSLTNGFRRLLETGDGVSPLDFPSVTGLFPRLGISGSVLEAGELARIARYAGSAGKLKRFILQASENRDLVELAEFIPDLDSLVRGIFRVINRDGELMEDSVPELKAVRDKLKRLSRDVDRLIAAYMTNPEYRTFWQTDQPTQKDGRVCLPLKTNYKGRIGGIVHEVSGSGATVYLEPLDVVEGNNDVTEAEQEYKREVLKILRSLTAEAAASLQDLRRMSEQVSFLDSFHARARYAVVRTCSPASLSAERIVLLDARHPLLGRKVVPISLDLEERNRTLIITGPNTGGKTVTLKTVGLLSLMNQFGMQIPVADGSCLPVFDNFLADIGDEQSLQQSLSTFSSHIVNLTRIIRSSSMRSLVLLDELGAGTDPEEGVAIAMALLDHFIDKGCFCLATTHHGILKNYGYTREGVENASMEFDDSSLEPTFRIVIGIPGSSHALEIAERVGIPGEITGKARTYLDDERGDIAELIRQLSERQRELIRTERTHERRVTEFHEQKRETDLKELRLRQRERELRQHGLRDIRLFLDESRHELDKLIKGLREGELNRQKTREVSEFLQSVRGRVIEEEQRIESQMEEVTPDFPVEEGMIVRIASTGKWGRVLRKAKGKRWVVETDVLKASLLPGEFVPAIGQESPEDVEIVATRQLGDIPALELDVRGMRREEAIRCLEKQIDDSLLHGLSEFSIIHGKGEGVLQESIQTFLSKSRVVEEYSFSRPEEGGFGRTIVQLKRRS